MKIRKGQKVEIWEADQSKLLGIGIYLGLKKLKCVFPKEIKKYYTETSITIPKFRLGKKIIYGCDCWWITVSEATKLKKEFHFNP